MFRAYKTMCSVVPRHEKARAILREDHKIRTRGDHEETRRGCPGVLNARHLQPAFPGVSKGSSSAETLATPRVSPVTGTLSSVMVSPWRLSDHPAKGLLQAQDVLVPEPVMSSGFPLPSPALEGASPPGCFLGPLPPVFAGKVISRPRARSDFCLSQPYSCLWSQDFQ
ncbi:hypothetical protein J1605_009449 [Eschrichtius robustus]|uniref:Uncharacterized protein n=1 Tax=Eschrichtius robustus TaxID=9764 RepID=A0AB34GVQ5_ESCRO|nr:hypothetical protein J1605_009449 [Eschrichtius robustus]